MGLPVNADSLRLIDDLPASDDVRRPELVERSSKGEIIVGDARKVLADFSDRSGYSFRARNRALDQEIMC